MVTTNPVSCSGDRDWWRISQPSTAPVIGAASPNRGGAAAGRRRMPLNQMMKASAVPTRLRYMNPATLCAVSGGGAPSAMAVSGNRIAPPISSCQPVAAIRFDGVG
jgi:hypothetical protein